MMKFRGYTLSEILIALLVLGIIVSASVPVIMKLAPNKNVAMIKKAYYITESIVNGLINDPYYYPDNSIHCRGFANSGTGSLNSTTGGTCYYGFDDGRSVVLLNEGITTTHNNAESKFRCLFASKLNIKEDLAIICNSDNPMTTMDGMTWNLRGLTMENNSSTIHIDVDGVENGVHAYSKGNRGLCASKDEWSSSCNGDLTASTKRHFDRIEINIHRDGKISIDNSQQDFLDIISGKKKVINGDDD